MPTIDQILWEKQQAERDKQEQQKSFAQRQAEAQALADAQRRRFEAEQQARLQQAQKQAQLAAQQAAKQAQLQAEAQARQREAQRLAQEQQVKQAQQARFQAEQQARIQNLKQEKVTVKKGDTASSIASILGITPEDFVNQVGGGRLIAGQRFNVNVPAQTAGPQFNIPEPQAPQTTLQSIVTGFGNFMKNTLGLQGAGMQHATAPAAGTPFEKAFGNTSFASPAEYQNYEPYIPPFVDTQRGLDIAIKNKLQNDYQYLRKANMERGLKVYSMRYTHQALAYAWETGDMNARPNFITQFEWDNLSPDQQQKVQEDLGYVFDPDQNVWVPLDLPEENYGMGGYGGGYTFPSYGGGGGEYTPPRYTSSYFDIQTGGKVRPEAGRLTAGYVPASHWRI